MKRLLQQSMVYGLGSAMNQFLALMILPLFTAYLTPADYGVNSVLNLFGTLLIGAFSLGLGNSIGLVYFECKDILYQKQVISGALWALVPSILVLLCGAGFGGVWFSQVLFQTSQYHYLVSITFVTSILSLIILPLNLQLQFQEKSLATVVSYSLVTLIGLSLSTLFIVVFRWGILGRFLGHAIGLLFLMIFMLIFSWKNIVFSLKREIIRSLFHYGFPTILSFLFHFILQQGNIYMLKAFATLEDVGLYSVGMNFGNALSLGVSAFLTAWTPFAWSFKEKSEEARLLFGRVMSYYLLTVGSLSICLYLFAKPLILLFTHQHSFYQAWRVVGLSSTSQLMVGIVGIIGVEHYMAKDLKYGVLIQGVTAFIFVLLSMVLVSRFQGVGAALALLASHMLMNGMLIYWNYVKRSSYLNIKYENARINQFIFFYVFIIGFSFLEGDAFSWIHFVFHVFLLAGYAIYSWTLLLHERERNFVRNYFLKLQQKFSL